MSHESTGEESPVRYRRRSPRRRHPERSGRGGVLLLSQNHIALLKGLVDRPNSTAISRGDWVTAALPYLRLVRVPFATYWTLAKALLTLPTTLYRRRRFGNQVIFWLSVRGARVLSGEQPVRVIGKGMYREKG